VDHEPALLALGAIVAVALSQLLLHSSKAGMGAASIVRAALLSALVGTAYFSLRVAFHFMLATSFPAVRIVNGTAQIPLIGVVILVFFTILLIQQSLPNLGKYPVARRAEDQGPGNFFRNLLIF